MIRMSRIGQNRIYTPYMTVYLVISLPQILYVHRIYMVMANPKNEASVQHIEELNDLQGKKLELIEIRFQATRNRYTKQNTTGKEVFHVSYVFELLELPRCPEKGGRGRGRGRGKCVNMKGRKRGESLERSSCNSPCELKNSTGQGR